MRIIAGKTVSDIRRRLNRLHALDRGLHRVMTAAHRMVENRYIAADGAISRAIADRQTVIRVASDEIAALAELGGL